MDIYLYSHNKKAHITWTKTEGDSEDFFKMVLEKCPGCKQVFEGILIVPANKNSREVITEYSEKQDDASSRNSRKLKAYVNNLDDGRVYFVIDVTKLEDDYIRLAACHALNASTQSIDVDGLSQLFKKFYSGTEAIEKIYQCYVYGIDGLACKVGEPEKGKRKCRFCGRTGTENFQDVAHAIPESLGNTILICNEECDVCNHNLNAIEDNLIALMDFRRAIYRIKRKESSSCPNIDGQNFVIRDDGNGHTMIYVAEESLPDDWKSMDELPVRLNQKFRTTNENIYKAMVKIAIDLMPSQYLSMFDETIEWLTSKGHFICESLPSSWMAVLPVGSFYEQPELHLYIKRDKGHSQYPYCFAMLRIYDLCYRYIIPFTQPDSGRFRKNEELVDFWSNFKTDPPLEWIEQNTSEWWQSAPWVEVDLPKNHPSLHIRPFSDSIFDKCREQSLPNEIEYPYFDSSKIKISFDRVTFKAFVKMRLSQDILRDIRVEYNPPVLEFWQDTENVDFRFRLEAMSTDKRKRYFECEIRGTIYTPDFSQQVIFDGPHVNGQFSHEIWDIMIAEASRQLENKMKISVFNRIKPLKDFTSGNDRFFRQTMYVFIRKDGWGCRFPFSCMHEEISHTKRVKLLEEANALK